MWVIIKINWNYELNLYYWLSQCNKAQFIYFFLQDDVNPFIETMSSQTQICIIHEFVIYLFMHLFGPDANIKRDTA